MCFCAVDASGMGFDGLLDSSCSVILRNDSDKRKLNRNKSATMVPTICSHETWAYGRLDIQAMKTK